MFDAVAAEALKMRRHRGTWSMVWIVPILTLVLALGSFIYGLLAGSGPAEPAGPAAAWIAESTIFWRLPASAPGRLLIAGFAALIFAGEYGWNTWKLVIPARPRWQLIAAKWLVAVGFVFAALVTTNVIVLIGEWLHSTQGSPIPDGVTLGALLQAHARMAAYALLPIAYAVTFAGLFAVLTKSILATVVLSIVMLFIEGLLPVLGAFAYSRAPAVTQFLIEVLPSYHLMNMNNWAAHETGLVLPLAADASIALTWTTSFLATLGWLAIAAVGTLLRFLRQDLN